MNTCNTLLDSYQKRVYRNTLATVKWQIQKAENPMPGMVISMEAVCVDNAILLDYLTSEVALEDPEIGSPDPNIAIDNDFMDDERHFGMPGGSRDYKAQCDQSDERDAIPTASRWWQPVTGLEWFYLGTSIVDGFDGNDGDDADADEEEEASLADHGSTQNVEDWGHSTRDCEDWTWRWCVCGWGGRSIASRWWINAECWGLRA